MTRAGLTAKVSPVRAWSVLVLIVLARAYRAIVLTLLAAALIPTMWSWSDQLIRTGSMEPAISVGDVVIAAPMASTADVPLGRVMVFTDPVSGKKMVHRVVAKRTDGNYTTAGDANAQTDTTPVPRNLIHSQARLLVPYIGLPALWFANGQLLLLFGWGVPTAVAFALAHSNGRPRHTPTHRAPGGQRAPRPHGSPKALHPAHPRGAPHVAWRAARLIPVVLVIAPAMNLALASPAVAARTFTTTTRDAGNAWGAANVLQQAYVKQVLTDGPYFFYRVDEASGSTAADSSGNGRTGTYFAIGAYAQPGALPNNAGSSVLFNGNSARILGGGSAISNPTTFTLELWFKTTSSTGGKLIGFGSSTGSNSSTYDRHIFMDTAGRIVYGAWPNGTVTKITTTAAYNNGSWHYLALTATPHGNQQDSIMYIDGANVGSATTTRTSSYSGYWQIGYGPLPTGTGYPTNRNFIGTIDNIAVYQSALSSTRISAHYASR